MTRKLFMLCLWSFLTTGIVVAQVSKDKIEINLPKMYQEVDEAIEQSPKYVRDYEKKISDAKESMVRAKTDEQRMLLMMQLCELYESFNGDSALSYAFRATKIAHKLELADVEADYQARCAYLCTFLGSQTEALTLLKRIDKKKLTKEGLGIYYRAYLSSYETLSDNCKMPELRKQFHQLHMLYLDSLLRAVPKGSELYYFYYEDQLIKKRKLAQALEMNDERLNMSGVGSHEDAIIAYSRHRIYKDKGNREMAIYWLCRSALADIRNAVMDQLSLITLAEVMDAQGDYDRSSRYISFTWECNRRYSPHMRAWQITPLMSAIENNFQMKLDEKNRQVKYLTISSAVLLFLLIVMILRGRLKRKKKQDKTVH